jgi:hypothetical protein
MSAKDALLAAFDRLFDRAATKLHLQCDADDREEAKKQFTDRFAALLDALARVDVSEIPDEALTTMEQAIDKLSPKDVAALLVSIPLAQQGNELLRSIAYRAAEQRLLDHWISQADDTFGGN